VQSRKWYAVAAIVLVIGAGIAGWLFLSGLAAARSALTWVVVPGSAVMTLAEPGSYTIFHEPESVVDGRIYSSQNISGLRVTLTSEATKASVPLASPRGSLRYSFGGHEGVSVFALDIAEPGRYRLAGDFPGGQTEPATVLAIGHAPIGRLFGTLFGAIAAALVAVPGAIAIAGVTFANRQRARRAALSRTSGAAAS
jgi:hypothetical protein